MTSIMEYRSYGGKMPTTLWVEPGTRHPVYVCVHTLLDYPIDLKPFKTFPVEVEASFKLPLFLPSNATFLYTSPGKRRQVFFEVRDADNPQQLYLNGKTKC